MREAITIIGAGNVATHMAMALSQHFDIACIAARSLGSASQLASTINSKRGNDTRQCMATTNLAAIPSGCKMYLIAVNDDAIENVVDATPNYPGIWAHTSGSVGKDVFEGKKSNYGVFYPLQTFSKNAEMDMRQVPMLIEGNKPEVVKTLCDIADKIFGRVIVADSAVREKIHIAAVFACNFANLMWLEADELLRDNAIDDISLFTPLLQQTLKKLEHMSPREAMTGPARRGDTKVLDKHLRRLPPEQQEIYRLLSDRILKIYESPE